MRKLQNPEERILDRALYLIGKNGSSRISVREIANEAKVNVGAINYYFRTKKEMLRQVDEFYLKNTIDSFASLDNPDLSDTEKIVCCSDAIMEYSLRYPGISVILKEKESGTDDLSREIVETTQKMNHKLFEILRRVIGGDDKQFEFNMIIFYSAILQPFSGIYRIVLPEAEFLDQSYRRKYIRHLLDSLKK